MKNYGKTTVPAGFNVDFLNKNYTERAFDRPFTLICEFERQYANWQYNST